MSEYEPLSKSESELIHVHYLDQPEAPSKRKHDADIDVAVWMEKRARSSTHLKVYSPKWEQDPNYQGWVRRSVKGDGYYYCLACKQDYTCGKSELDKHASSRKHASNMDAIMNDEQVEDEEVLFEEVGPCQISNVNSSTGTRKEETFGNYIISELKRIKRNKTFEIVKWEILQTLQKAMLQEAEMDDDHD